MELKISLVIYLYFFFFFLFLFLLSFTLSFFFSLGKRMYIETFFLLGGLTDLPFSFSIDFLSLVFFSAVCLISRVVFLYRKFYIEDNVDSGYYYNKRFFFVLFFFVLSIAFLVFSGSWVTLLLGWDGLGVISFLLVIFYRRRSRLVSGLLTVLTNRLGDCFFVLSFMYFFYNGGGLSRLF